MVKSGAPLVQPIVLLVLQSGDTVVLLSNIALKGMASLEGGQLSSI
jgi:uncharacterized Zn ribbon protein